MSTPYYADESVTLWAGDCRDVLATLRDASVDSVVTDPPYDLTSGKRGGSGVASLNVNSPAGRARISTGGFMGKEWDSTGVAFDPALWREVLRVLKPGGHLLAFGGSRTWHRLASAIEDAGFELRDSIAWLYGSGFPKSLDVSKAIDKAAGAERATVGRYTPPNGKTWNLAADVARAEIGATGHTSRADSLAITAPATPDAAMWEGWGTALKPAFEPIVVARKPLAGTVAANVLTHGTGALNIDACRIEHASDADLAASKAKNPGRADTVTSGTYGANRPQQSVNDAGRWPTNVVLDDTQAAELDKQSGISRDGSTRVQHGFRDEYVGGKGYDAGLPPAGYGGEGGASRFFPTFRYEAKAPTDERPRANGIAHPTVKPLGLMRWLVRLVTPPGGVVLEPFAGSGTTAEACITEGFRCIAIEREPDYLPLIKQRITKPIAVVLDLEGGAA